MDAKQKNTSRRTPASHIRILCVDDHPVVREGIAFVLELQPDMRVVAVAGSGEQAVSMYREVQPDVTLMDLQLPGMSGREAIRAICSDSPEARIIVLTMHHGDEDIYQAMQAGATTYLLKDMLSKDLVRVIREVHAGNRPIPEEIAARLASRTTQQTLTPREQAVIKLVADGLSNKQIGTALNITEETVHSHIRNIFVKLRVSDRVSATNVATRRGIIHVE